MKQLLWVSFLALTIYSCSSRRSEAEKIVNNWVGKQISFPHNYQCKVMDRDTVCPGIFQTEFKILLYLDSVGCVSCKLHLDEWKSLIHEAESLVPDRFNLLIFIHPKNEKEIFFYLKRDEFNYPVFIDKTDELNRINQFPDQPEYQCFLLDRFNQVVALGNPIQNPRIWELYKKQIVESK